MATLPGPMMTFPESDYLYGAGPLTMVVHNIERADPFRYDGEDWYLVQGIVIGYDGAERAHREVLVRARRLPPAPTP